MQPGGRMNSLGDAWIDVHGNTRPFERETERGVRDAANEADDEAEAGGDQIGSTMAKAMGSRLRESGPQLAREVERGLSRQRIKTKVTAQLDREGNVVRQWVTTITDEITDAFDKVDTGPTGPLGKLRMAIADAIGAGFNISGRSPLIAFLVPAIGSIVALVIGAIQAVNSLIALLVTIPGLLASIGIQVAVLMIAFEGVGTAIQGAFAAKNAKELNEALKDLTPSAQSFVRELLPLRPIFKDIRAMVQENFFKNLGSLFGDGGALLPLLATVGTLGQVASALGRAFRDTAEALGSPEMVTFIQELTPVIIRFLDRLGPSLAQFITGIAEFAGSPAVLGMLAFLGEQVTIFIARMGSFFESLSSDQGFAAWLVDMQDTFNSLMDFIVATTELVATLLFQLDQAGAKELIDGLTEGVQVLTAFLASDVGKEGLEGLIAASLFLFQTMIGLIAIILSIFALFRKLAEIIQLVFRVVWEGLRGLWGDIVGFFKSEAPNQIKGALGNLDNLLYNAGRNLIAGLINGIRSMIPNVRSAMNVVMSVIRAFTPFSPAKEGPLSGSGDPMKAGENIIDRLAAGITAGSQELGTVMNSTMQNITFGPGSVRVGFEGALPTSQQAMQTGVAVGQGALSVLARNTRMAVRVA